MRTIFNILIVAVEVVLVATVAWLAWASPVAFAAVTFLLALVLGLRLEVARIEHEMPFYFERTGRVGRWFRIVVGSGEAVLKATLAAAIALIVFSGTDSERIQLLASIFAILVLLGSMALRRATISLGLKPARWGFFRLGAPLGLAYSIATSVFPSPKLTDIAWRAVFDLPRRPSLAQLGETLFSVRLWADDMIVRLLATWLGPDGSRIAGTILSSNVLTGFVIALYAVAVAEVVRVMEERALTG